MEIVKSQSNNKTVFTLTGRLDTTTAPQLQETLLPAFEGGAHVELDFAALAYVSSAGLRVLLLGEKAAKSKGGVFSLVNVSDEIKEVFEMTGFTDILKIA
ncbi:MAG: STAS domain-containing protein [Chitinispirillia bacterium]|nr:STAS domain-containing protein [Chitinispirillia bacterium]MCL2267722.1 STAS domain-containing protein [Chitinispirillia bacterium]